MSHDALGSTVYMKSGGRNYQDEERESFFATQHINSEDERPARVTVSAKKAPRQLVLLQYWNVVVFEELPGPFTEFLLLLY